jgi:purine-binding chemotaxis protein CheW
MSENDRMDRAERIRQMREGKREGDDDPEPSTDGNTATAESDVGTNDPEDGDDHGGGTPDGNGSGRPVDRTAGAVGGSDSESDDGDPTPAEVVEAVAGTSATVPSPEEVETAVEGATDDAPDSGDAESETAAGVGTSEEDGHGTDTTEGESPASPAGVAEESTAREAETRVLEFALADEWYCLDIQYIEEIVKQETVTRVPNTPDFVEGVVDLRGQITTILNPKVPIGKDDQAAGDLIVVFDAEVFDDQGAIGWVVDDVRRVSPVTDDQINDPPMGEDYINGVIDREDDEEFVVWTTPDLALEEAG